MKMKAIRFFHYLLKVENVIYYFLKALTRRKLNIPS